jgi:hypothetical protein
VVLGLLAKLLLIFLFAAEGTGPMPQCALLHYTVPHSTPLPPLSTACPSCHVFLHPPPTPPVPLPQDVQTGNPQCLIPLDNIDVEAVTDSSDTLRMYSTIPGTSIKSAKKPRGARGSFVQGKHEDFVLRASSGRDRDAWVNALKLEVTRGPFMRLIDSKRRQAAALSTMDPFAARLSR